MIQFHGRGASAGIASGPVYVYQRGGGGTAASPDTRDPAEEWERFLRARAAAAAWLEKTRDTVLKQHGGEAAMLFDAYILLAWDADLTQRVESGIREKQMMAETAVREAARQYVALLSETDDLYMQARSADVREVCGRILAALAGRTSAPIRPPQPSILWAEELFPGEAAGLDPDIILGVILAGDSVTDHTSILLRAKGIPAVIRTGRVPVPGYSGREALIDGGRGEVVIAPDGETCRRMLSEREAEKTVRLALEQYRGLENVTKDGKRISVYCNISSPDEVGEVLSYEGDGIGLFRSEFLYLGRQDYPSEELQFEAFRRVLTDMRGKRVVIRTADLGGDKQEEYLSIPAGKGPAGELRGLRLCLERPEMFRTQLRALFRASVYGELGIMFPMVTSVSEVREAKALCAEVKKELGREGKPFREDTAVGIMIEHPEAVLISDQLAGEADFFSFGTNDLIRSAEDGSGIPGHPEVLRLLKLACGYARRGGISTEICGELAADPAYTAVLLAMGIDAFSVPPRDVLRIRRRIRETDISEVRERMRQIPD